MSWFDSIIGAIRDAFYGVASQVTDTIDNALGGVFGALNFVSSGIRSTIYQTTNTVGNLVNAVHNDIDGRIAGAQSTITNTLGAVQNNILGSLDDIQGSVYNTSNNVINAVTGNISNALSNVTGTLYGAVSSVQNQIAQGQSAIGNALGSVTSTISSNINAALSQVGNTFGGIASGLAQQIDQGLAGLGSGLGQLVGGIQSGIDQALNQVAQLTGAISQTIASTLANITPSIDGIVGVLQKGIDWQPLVDLITKPVSDWAKGATDGVKARVTAKQEIIARIASGQYKDLAEVLSAIADPPPALDPVTGVLDAFYGMVSLIFAFNTIAPIYTRALGHAVNQQHETEILTPDTLANAVNQNVATPDQAIQEGSWWGLDRAHMEQLILLAGNPPGIEQVLEMWRREFVSESQVDNAILESRLKSKYLDPIKKLRFVLPPLADVIRMAVREAWDDATAARYNYDDDFPSKVQEIAPQLGVDPDWIKRYWRAHWVIPSFQQLAEMLHRQKETGVDLGIVDSALRVADIPKYWRDKLVKISYNPFTRVDVRRMYKVGVLNRDQVTQAYRDIGYDEQRAQALADFTVKLEDSQGQLDPDTLERKVYTALENLFVRGKRSESDLTAAMQAFGWGQEAIDYQLQIARLRQEAYNKVDSKDASGLTEVTVQRQIVERQIDLYVRNQGALGDVSALMSEYGWGQEIQDLILKRATLDKLFDAAPTQKTQLRDLSQSAILEAYAAHTFGADETKTRLVALGNTADDAQTLVDIKDYQEASSVRTKIVAALQKAFLQNRLTEAEVTTSLLQFGFSQPEASNYVTLWSLDKSLQHKDFTEPQLATFLKHQVISPEQYTAALSDLGWSAEQISWWLALRGVDVSITG